jgi:exodeoxyribonuclease-3
MKVFRRTCYRLATPELAAGAKMVEIYKDQKFSDHATVTVGYDWGA